MVPTRLSRVPPFNREIDNSPICNFETPLSDNGIGAAQDGDFSMVVSLPDANRLLRSVVY
jgi:hypothetical protein